jgi:hypothetical protein
MDNPKKTKARRVNVCQILSLDESMEIIKYNGHVEENMPKEDFLLLALSEKSFGDYQIFPYDMSNPSSIKYPVQLTQFPPVLNEIFIVSEKDKITGKFVLGYVDSKLPDFRFQNNGIVLKNGETYIPNLHYIDEYPLLEWSDGYSANLGNFLWNIFSNNKLEPDEEVLYINGNKMDYRLSNMVKIKRERKNSGKKPVIAINIDTDEILEFESSYDADRKTKYGRKNIENWANDGALRHGYMWKRKDKINELPILKEINPNIPYVTLIMNSKIDDITEEISKLIEISSIASNKEAKLNFTRSAIIRAANSKKNKMLGGYYWISADEGPKFFEISHIKTTTDIFKEKNGTYIDLNIPVDPILKRRPICVKYTKIILYENGKYKYPGDIILRPRSTEDIENAREIREEKLENYEQEKEKEIQIKLEKEIKKYDKYRVTRADRSYKVEEQQRKKIDNTKFRNQKLNDFQYDLEQQEISLKLKNVFDNKKSYRLAYLILKNFGILKNIYKKSSIKYLDGDERNCHIRNLMKTYKN